MTQDIIDLVNNMGTEEKVKDGIQFSRIDGGTTPTNLYAADKNDDDSCASDKDYESNDKDVNASDDDLSANVKNGMRAMIPLNPMMTTSIRKVNMTSMMAGNPMSHRVPMTMKTTIAMHLNTNIRMITLQFPRMSQETKSR